jgi:hypothetical protein
MDGYISGFQAWAKTRGLSDSTIRAYVAFLRGFLRSAERVGNLLYAPGLVEMEAVAHEASLLDGSRRMFRSSLRAFLRFAGEKEGIDPSQLAIAFPDRRAARWKGSMSHPVVPILQQMAPHLGPFIGPKILERLKWSNVTKETSSAGVECGVIRDNVTYVNAWVPIAIMRALALWAGGDRAPAKDLPLIPTEPRSSTPMPAVRIRRFAGIKTGRRIPAVLRPRHVPGV